MLRYAPYDQTDSTLYQPGCIRLERDNDEMREIQFSNRRQRYLLD
jgi:hypothetical protein